jgi:hypothetical protein
MPKKEYSKLALRHQKYEPGFMVLNGTAEPD